MILYIVSADYASNVNRSAWTSKRAAMQEYRRLAKEFGADESWTSNSSGPEHVARVTLANVNPQELLIRAINDEGWYSNYEVIWPKEATK